ncbi:MAG: hypothetical protein GPJ54_04910 [Candidatus Heimdallarchaeota archaeon]|nr:hypothetical protein [Candidatus Heimdallarchaeota archaeon]
MTVPTFKILDHVQIDSIISQAFEILDSKGVFIENEQCLNLFSNEGLDNQNGWVKIPIDLIKKSVKSTPKSIQMYDRDNSKVTKISKDTSFFVPGSTALLILDGKTAKFRKPISKDYIDYVKVVDQLDNLKLQSTAMISNDIDSQISDLYRLYLSLIYSTKPIITGTFRKESFEWMKKLLVSVRGDEIKLKEQPLAIFDASTTSPLNWSDLTCQSLIDAAEASIPSDIISMPMMGANTPASMFSATVIHTAEILSGIVISQLAKSGSPVIWGGSSSVFDMQKGTTPIGAIESMMMTSAYSQVGKSLDLPTHGYTGLSDSKSLDFQSGFETGFGLNLATVSGLNVIVGAGMINFQSAFSIEKMIIDNDIIGMTNRLRQGITDYENINTVDILNNYEDNRQFLTHKTTRSTYRKENYFPSNLVDRGVGEDVGGLNIVDRARASKNAYLESYSETISHSLKSQLTDIMKETGYKLVNID